MSNLTTLILNMFSDYFCMLPNALNTRNVFLFFNAITREGIKYVVIAFQNTSKTFFKSIITKLF